MSYFLELVLGNFPMFCLILAFLIVLFFKREKSFGEMMTRYLLLLPMGLGGLWGFYYHAFYPEMSAELIGWANSPFQFEVALANLGMGVVGIVGFWRSRDFALAAILMVSCFLWGAAFGHIREIFLQDNYAPGNAGSILFSDLLIPASLWLGYLLWKQPKRSQIHSF